MKIDEKIDNYLNEDYRSDDLERPAIYSKLEKERDFINKALKRHGDFDYYKAQLDLINKLIKEFK